MGKNDFVRLRHILDAAREAVGFIQGRSRHDIEKSRQLALSLIKLVEIMGEAAAGVSKETQALFPQVPWLYMIRMRNRLIHGYFDIDYNMVWDTINSDIPPLIEVLETIINNEWSNENKL